MHDSSDNSNPANASEEFDGIRIKPGAVLAQRYLIEQKLGEGGMGIVFKSHDQLLARDIALKILLSAYSHDDVLRFQREAQACGALQHRNIIQVMDFGILEGGKPYLAMEYVAGNTLDSLIEKDGGLSLEFCLDIGLQICAGMSKAQEAGIVHRDLKPSNIILVGTESGGALVKIIDFGVAKDTRSEQQLTKAGVGIGSPLYMSPEQIKGEAVDSRSDIYSFGCLLFEMLVGTVPFTGKNAFETINMHVSQPPPAVSEKAAIEIPPQLDALIARCLEKEKELRFSNFSEIERVLSEIEIAERIESDEVEQTEFGPLSEQQQKNTSLPLVALATGLSLLLFAGLAFIVICTGDPDDSVSRKIDVKNIEHFADNVHEVSSSLAQTSPQLDYVGDENVEKIAKTIRKQKQTRLDLGYRAISGSGLKALRDCHLIYLDVGKNPITEEGMNELGKLTTLETVSANSTPMTPAKLKHLKNLPHLTSLHINASDITDDAMKVVCELNSLEILHVKNNKLLTERSIQYLLEGLPVLHTLDLDGTEFSGKAITRLAKKRSLRSLDVSNNLNVTGDTIRAFIGKEPPILDLSVSGTSLKPSDLKTIARLPLLNLYITNMNLHDGDLDNIAGMKLQRLDISKNKITDSGLFKLRKLTDLTNVSARGNPGITKKAQPTMQTILSNVKYDDDFSDAVTKSLDEE